MTYLTFIGAPPATLDDLGDARVVVMGASEASPYGGETSHSARAPTALREASMTFARQLRQLDFDLDATMLPEEGYGGIVDIGDIPTSVRDAGANHAAIRDAVAGVLAIGAVPTVLGGDDSVPIPVLDGYREAGPVTILQIDAHVDWGDTIRGNPNGYGSPMRRAAEMPWVDAMVQVGIRGLGSGQAWQTEDARAWGSRIVTSRAFRELGPAGVAALIEPGARVVISIDCDGLDPAIFPAVAMPTPGGLGYDDVVALFHAIRDRAEIAGLILAEYVPDHDDGRRLCALTAARIASVTIGLALR